MNKKAGAGKIVLIILILVVLLGAIYFTFFFYYSCDDKDIACFKAHQEKCSKTKFLNDNEDALWNYKIKGKENTVVIDPYDPSDVGYKLPKLEGDIVLISHSHKDHRVAMSLAIAGMIAEGQTEIQEVRCIDTSFPGFARMI